jgi:hypothetical protein
LLSFLFLHGFYSLCLSLASLDQVQAAANAAKAMEEKLKENQANVQQAKEDLKKLAQKRREEADKSALSSCPLLLVVLGFGLVHF